MPSKLLLVLANSLKRGGRCIAGREVLWRPDGRWYLGGWIRPVSTHGGGELFREETLYPDGEQVQVMDFASVSLLEPEGEVSQPENWVIQGSKVWDRPDRVVKLPPMAALEQKPANLWIDKAEMNDRISPHRLAELRPGFSLCVIKPTELTLAWWTEISSFKNRPQHKFQAQFAYNGENYRLSLTDPVASERFCTPVPPVGEDPRTLALSAAQNPLLCVSLTPLFGGFHYKVAATILGYE